MNIFNNVSSPSMNVNPNESRQTRNNAPINQNSYKEAFKLDINPRYLGGEVEKIAIADSDALFYTSHLDVIKKH